MLRDRRHNSIDASCCRLSRCYACHACHLCVGSNRHASAAAPVSGSHSSDSFCVREISKFIILQLSHLEQRSESGS